MESIETARDALVSCLIPRRWSRSEEGKEGRESGRKGRLKVGEGNVDPKETYSSGDDEAEDGE